MAQRLGVGHTVFLSHSGEDKEFVMLLAEELRMRCFTPFFDQDSLQKGDKVGMDDILVVAKTCKLGLIVLSDHFFSKTKNPMLELLTFVEHDVKFLPLFYKLSVNEVKDEGKKAEWKEKWSQWSINDSRISIPKWNAAVNALTGINGPESAHLAKNFVEYARIVADEVCKILFSDICPSDEHVQGKERLCKEVKHMFANAPVVRGAKVLALYGMEGAGKSTLCTALRRSYHFEFVGRVCYVALSRHNERNHNGLQLQDILTVLFQLTNVNLPFVKTHITDVDKGIAYLDTHLPSANKFLLILDNIHEYSLDEASQLVLNRRSFPCGSHLLFLGRSRNSLARLLGPIDNGHVICRFPDLHFREVEMIFLNETLLFLQSENVIQQRQRSYEADPNMQAIVKQCVDLCTVSSGSGSYNPLMLKSLALFLRSIAGQPIKWKKTLSKLKKDRSEAMQNMFESLQQSYDTFHQKQQNLFLDLALYTLAGKDVRKLHFEGQDAGVDDCLLKLTDASFWSKDTGVLGVHRDFARKLARQSGHLLFVQDATLDPGFVYSRLLPKQSDLQKLAFVNCTFSAKDACLDLSGSKHVEVLLLDDVRGLNSVNLGSNELRRMEVNSTCAVKVEKIRTISLTLCAELDEMSWYNPMSLCNPEFLVILELCGPSWEVHATHLRGCSSLRFVHLDNIKLTDTILDLSCWPSLEELKLSYLAEASMLSGLQNLVALRKFSLTACNRLAELQLPGSLTHCSLEKCEGLVKVGVVGPGMFPFQLYDEEESTRFSVCDCEELEELSGLCELKHINSFVVVGGSRLHKVNDILDFSQVGTDSGDIPFFISYLELTGHANIESLRQLSVEQVRKRGLVKELVEKTLKDATGLKRLTVKCAEPGLCGCDAFPPNFGLMPHLQYKNYKCHLGCIDAPSRPVSSEEYCFPKVDVSCAASCLELEKQESISNTTGRDLRVTQKDLSTCRASIHH